MKKRSFFLIFISAVILLSGCWSSKEPKYLDIVDSSFYDREADGNYHTMSEVMNPMGLGGAGMLGGAGGNKSTYITSSGTGPSLREAIANQTMFRENIVFGAHIKVRFLSERFASDGISSLLDMITREHLTDEKPLMIVIDGDEPENVYNCMIGTSEMVGDYIESQSKQMPKESGKGIFITTLEFIRDYYTEGKEPVTGLIKITESSNIPSGNTKQATRAAETQTSSTNYVIQYEGLAAFRDASLVGTMDGNEAQAYNFLNNKIQAAYFTVQTGNGSTIVIHITGSKSIIKSDLIDGKAVINIKLKASGTISEENGEIDVTKPEGIKAVENALNGEIEEQVVNTIKKVQELKSDIFGFGEFLNIQHPKKWNEVKDSWNDGYFPNAEINLTVKTDINQIGEIEKPFVMGGAG